MAATVMVTVRGKGVVPYPSDLDPENPGTEYGTLLPRILPDLDRIAETLGNRTPQSFLYMDPLMLTMALETADGEILDELEKQFENQREWHSVADGIAMVNALLSHLEGTPPEKAREQWPVLWVEGSIRRVLWELRALRAALNGYEYFHLEAM